MATLMTVAQLREHFPTALDDVALQRLLDAAEQDIMQWCGALTVGSGDTWEPTIEDDYHSVGMSVLQLHNVPLSIDTVEHIDSAGNITELLEGEDMDWVLDGHLLRRKGGLWGAHTRVTYTPATRVAQYRSALVLLVQLQLNVQPGQKFTGAATWQETYVDYEQERQRILWSLCPPAAFA